MGVLLYLPHHALQALALTGVVTPKASAMITNIIARVILCTAIFFANQIQQYRSSI
jgi:hypothetical protein